MDGVVRNVIASELNIDKHVDEYSFLNLWSFYVTYLLPMTVEVQWWDHKWEREGVGS